MAKTLTYKCAATVAAYLASCAFMTGSMASGIHPAVDRASMKTARDGALQSPSRLFIYDYRYGQLYVADSPDFSIDPLALPEGVKPEEVKSKGLFSQLKRARLGLDSNLHRSPQAVTFHDSERVAVWIVDASKLLTKSEVEGTVIDTGLVSDIAALKALVGGLGAGDLAFSALAPVLAPTDRNGGPGPSAATVAKFNEKIILLNSLSELLASKAEDRGSLAKSYLDNPYMPTDTAKADTSLKDQDEASWKKLNEILPRKISGDTTVSEGTLLALKDVQDYWGGPEMLKYRAEMGQSGSLIGEAIDARALTLHKLADAYDSAEGVIAKYTPARAEATFYKSYVTQTEVLAPHGDEFGIEITVAPRNDDSPATKKSTSLALINTRGVPLLRSSIGVLSFANETTQKFRRVAGDGGFVPEAYGKETKMVPHLALNFTYFPAYFRRNELNYGLAFGVAHPWDGLNSANINNSIVYVGLAAHKGDYFGFIGYGDARYPVIDDNTATSSATDSVPTKMARKGTIIIGFGLRSSLFGS